MTALYAAVLAWQERGACAAPDVPVEWFWPEAVEGRLPGTAYDKGKAVCAGCPVREECLAYALERRMVDGLWGGMTPGMRKKLRRARRTVERVCQRPDCRRVFATKDPEAKWCSGNCRQVMYGRRARAAA